ncbi:hypothetical protein ACH5RR_037686 [Cinchona calisaya]|uniref:Large ribosomal subunit protein uL11 C-terminal domain-containing protein n=1 Tax=Cinchona calisaya TaxID=153742 RepID=A0ABD2YBK8_9GENT
MYLEAILIFRFSFYAILVEDKCIFTVQNRQAKVSVVRSAAALVIKALKEPERDHKKTKNIKHSGNISLDNVIEIAKVVRPSAPLRRFLANASPLSARSMGKTLRICSSRLLTPMSKSLSMKSSD